MKNRAGLVAGILLLSLTGQHLNGETISFSGLSPSGVLSRQLDAVTPAEGCLASYDLMFPGFERGVINQSLICGWVSGYETVAVPFTRFERFINLKYSDIPDSRFKNAFHCGYYLLLQLSDGRYLAVLPLVSRDVMAFISVYEGIPRLKLCTFGTEAFTGEAPLCSWAFADDPYSATQICWELAVQSTFCKDNIRLRSDKEFPELYNYLGWCTWEAFGGDITEANVIQSITDIKKSPVPVRWVIVDDGYLDNKYPPDKAKPQILSFGTNSKFPNGWSPVTSLKDDASVKWIGIWRNMSGGMGGVSPEHIMTNLTDHLMLKTAYKCSGPQKEVQEEPSMIVKPDPASSRAFYEAMIGNTLDGGFDFVKVDFQTYNFWMYAGTGNAVNSAHQNNQALEAVCKEKNVALLNCISQCNVNVFNTRNSVISRSSVDIKLDNDNMSRTVQSFANNMWWGDILVGDFDMYHTSNEKTAQYLTIARAISGGPVYISDLPHEFNEQLVRPLIFKDGKIIRALAPAVPLPESLFSGLSRCYRVIAPTRHRSCSIAAFNFTQRDLIGGMVCKDDYPFAAAKEQPFNGLWAQPDEGLVLFDFDAQTGAILDESYTFTLNRMTGKLFTLAPVNQRWAVIGRVDKYLGGCTYTIDLCSEKELVLTLDESGPFVVYHADKTLETSDGTVLELGDGFCRVDLPIGEANKTITLSIATEQP